jgi:hypothetical protein
MADIIPFPSTRSSAAPASHLVPGPSDQRLSTALHALSKALAEQQEAVQRWRDALVELAASMRALGGDPAKEAAPAP